MSLSAGVGRGTIVARREEAALRNRRLTPDRFQRIWAIVERIDCQPGLDRRRLAEEFCLSERQLQADLLIVRNDMGLPLERRRGYRFLSRGECGDTLGVADAVTLWRLAQSSADDAALSAQMTGLLPRLATAFPARLQPFARAVLSPPSSAEAYHAQDILVALAEALLGRHAARVRVMGRGSSGVYEELTVDPQVLVPFEASWYVVGYCHERQRDVMLDVDELDPSFVEVLDFVRV